MARIIRTTEHTPRTVAGVDVAVTELVWDDNGRSFEVHRLDDGTDLTEAECFDDHPTDTEITALLQSHADLGHGGE